MRIKKHHRDKLKWFLDNFYNCMGEKYTIFHAVKFFKARLRNNRDAWMGVCGDTGTGKSLYALMFMILFGRPMTLTKNVAYVPKGEEIGRMFDKLNFQCLLVDEAAREMRAVNWQSRQQQQVNVKAMTDRFKNNMVLMNMPNFNEFTKSMRRGNLQFRSVIIYRNEKYARVVIQRKSRNWRSDDPWGDEKADSIYNKVQKRNKELDNDNILSIERSLPQTVMDFAIPNLELILPEVTDEYERLKTESRKLREEEDNNKPSFIKYKKEIKDLRVKFAKLLFFNPLHIGQMKVSQTQMAKALGVSVSTFKSYLEVPNDKKKNHKPRG